MLNKAAEVRPLNILGIGADSQESREGQRQSKGSSQEGRREAPASSGVSKMVQYVIYQ